jgi:hypothetical protein
MLKSRIDMALTMSTLAGLILPETLTSSPTFICGVDVALCQARSCGRALLDQLMVNVIPHTLAWKDPLATLVTIISRPWNTPFGLIMSEGFGGCGIGGVEVGVGVGAGTKVSVTVHEAVAPATIGPEQLPLTLAV